MKKSFLLLLLPISLFISSCTITGEAEDQFDEEEKADRIDLGNLLGIGNNNNNVQSGRSSDNGGRRTYYSSGTYSTEGLALDEESFKDFEAFKAWRRAQEEGTIDAQEYREWIEYQQYRAYKSQSEQKAAPAK